MMSIKSVSAILYSLDLMGTGCVENSLQDEYDSEAKEIIAMLEAKFPLVYSINTVFDHFFWDGCLSQKDIEILCEKISSSY